MNPDSVLARTTYATILPLPVRMRFTSSPCKRVPVRV